MGMENGTIPDSALKASSQVSKLQYNRKPYHTVLYRNNIISRDAKAKSSKLCRTKIQPVPRYTLHSATAPAVRAAVKT